MSVADNGRVTTFDKWTNFDSLPPTHTDPTEKEIERHIRMLEYGVGRVFRFLETELSAKFRH